MTSTELERENFLRNAILVVDHSKDALISLIELDIRNKHLSFEQFLNQSQHEIYHLYNNGRCCRCLPKNFPPRRNKIIFPAQMEMLFDKAAKMPRHRKGPDFCCSFANKGIGTDVLDLTLARCILVNCCTDVFWYSCLQFQGISFEDFLNQNKHLIYHLWKYNQGCCHCQNGFKLPVNRQIVDALQWNAMFSASSGLPMCRKRLHSGTTNCICFTSAISGISQAALDTILQQNILEYCCSNRKSMEVLVKIRNNVYGHTKAARISVTDYTRYKNDIEKAVLDIAIVCGKEPEFRTALNDVNHRRLDHTLLLQYQNSLLERKTDVSELFALVTDQTTKLQILEENIKESSRKAEEHTASKLQKLEVSKRVRLVGLTQTEIDGHLKEGTFVETPAVQACIKLLETHSLLILTGAAGTGKSRNSLEILHQFHVKYPEYETVKLTDLHDFTDVVTEEEKLVLLFEDIFGRTNKRFGENTDVQIIDRIHACTIKGNIKVILTVRDTIRISCQCFLNSHKIFHGKCEVDLSSEKFKMKKNEKESLLLKYFAAHNFQLVEYNDPENYFEDVILNHQVTATVNRVTLYSIVKSEPLLGFPEACSLFTGNRKLTRLGLSFFKHPSKYLFEEIEKLRKHGKDCEGDRMSYVTLVYVLLNDDVLDPDNIELKMYLEILESCYGISNKKLPVCHITDAANEMIGRYLILHCDDGKYRFQHQTIFESILISYSRIDPGLILPRLSFDFIKEMVRLQSYTLREGEVVMKITPKYYSMLANRIIEIIHSKYFNKSLSLNFQLLCESEIIRQNDECFMKYLIETAHDSCFKPEHSLQRFVTYGGDCRLCNLYLPALFLERISLQNKMNKSIILLVDHITSILNSEPEENIEFVCKSSLTDAFLHVCELENNENILDNIWVPIKNLFISEMTEYIRSSISRICSRCPITTMKWMLKNIDQSIFEMNYMLKRSCEFIRLDVVKFLCETINHDQFDFNEAFIAAINNVWNDPDESVSEWLIKNINHNFFDLKQITNEVLQVGSKKNLNFLLTNVDNCMLDMKLVFNKLYKEGRNSIESMFKWMITNVNKNKLNTFEMLVLTCMVEDIELVKFLFDNIESCLLDITSVLLSAVNCSWQGNNKNLIEWLCLNVDLKQINMMDIINEAFEKGKYDELKILLKNTKDNLNAALRNACYNNQLELLKMVLSAADHHSLLNTREAVRSVCVLEKMELLEFFLHNVDHRLYDAHHVLKESCRYGWIRIVKWLLDNIECSSLDIHTAMKIVLHREFEGPDKTLVKLLLQYPVHNTVDVADIIQECCWWGMLDLVELVCEKFDHKQLNMKAAMNTACYRSHFDLVKWMLSKVENKLFDMANAFNKAIDANFDDLNASLIQLLLGYTDHKLIDMSRLFKIGCRRCWYDIVEWVLHNADHAFLDFNEAINLSYDKSENEEPCCNGISKKDKRKKYEPLIKIILQQVHLDTIDLQEVLNQASDCGSLDVVGLVFKNNDHKMLDINKAMNIVYGNWKHDAPFCFEENDNNKRVKYEPLMILILQNVNPDSHDVKKVFNKACFYGSLEVVTLVLENSNHKMLDLIEAMNILYDNWKIEFSLCYGTDINDIRTKYEPLIQLILEKVNHDSLDLKKILDQAYRYGCLGVVAFMLENIDNEKLHVMEAVNNVYTSTVNDGFVTRDQIEMYEPSLKLILEKVNHDSLDLRKILNLACQWSFLDVVTFLLENTDHEKLDVMAAMNLDNKNIRQSNDTLIKLLLMKVNQDSLILKKILNQACRYGCLDVVTIMLENIDHEKIDIMEAVNNVNNSFENNEFNTVGQIALYEHSLKLIVEKVNHDSLDLKKIYSQACLLNCLDVVKILLEKIDHKRLDVMEAMNIVCMSLGYNLYKQSIKKRYETLIQTIFDKVNHDLLDLKKVFNHTCCYGCLDVVTFMLEKIDHEKLDVMEALNNVNTFYENTEFNMLDQDALIGPSLKLILEKVNHDSLDLSKVLNQACLFGCLYVVKFILENIDHEKLDIMEAVNNIYSSLGNDVDNKNIRRSYDTLIKLILMKVNHDSLVLKKILNHAYRYGCLDVVTFMLEKIDHEKLDVMEAVNNVNNSYENNEFNTLNQDALFGASLKMILEKVNHDSLDLRKVFNQACLFGCLHVVKFVFENFDHEKLDVMDAINLVYRSLGNNADEKNIKRSYEPLIKLILMKVNHDSLVLKKILNQACRYGCLDVVTYLLEKIDHDKLDVMEAVNDVNTSYENNEFNTFHQIALYEPSLKLILQKVNHDSLDLKKVFNQACLFGCLDVVKFVLENINHEKLDVMKAMNIVCRSLGYTRYEEKIGKPLIKLILEKVNHDLFDLKTVFNQACCYGCLDVVTYLLENIDHEKLDIMKAVNDVYMYSLLTDNVDNDNIRHIYETLINLILMKVNHDLLDLKKVFNQACCFCCLNVVTLVLEKIDRAKLDLNEAMDMTYDKRGNNILYCKGQKYKPLIKLILEKVNYDSLDFKEITNKACRYGSLDVVTFLLEFIDPQQLDIMKAVNAVYKSIRNYSDDDDINGKIEKYESLIGLILKNHDLLDMKKVFNQACCCGCLDIVTFVLENNDHKKLDVMKAVNDVYMYSSLRNNVDNDNIRHIYETLINMILMKVNHDLLDLKKVFNQACRFCCLNVVTLVLEKIDRAKLDLNEAMDMTYDKRGNNILCCKGQKYKPLIKLILEKVNYDSLDFKEITNKTCRYGSLDVVTFLLEFIDPQKLDIMKAVNAVYKSIRNYSDDDDINGKIEKYESLIGLILKNHDLLDMKKVFNQACCCGCLDIVTFVLENNDHKTLDIMKAVGILTSSTRHVYYDANNQRTKYEHLLKLILEKVNHNLLDLKYVFNRSCRNCYIDVVTFVLDNIDHETLDIMEAVNIVYRRIKNIYGELHKQYEPLIIQILDKVNHDLLVLKEIMNEACRYGYQDVVTFLLENTDHEKLDIMKAVNIAYSSIRGEDDDEDEINEKREKKKHLIKLILEKVDHDLLDLKKIMDEACRYGYQNVVTFLLENTDHEKLDIMVAVMSAYNAMRGGEYDDEVDIDRDREQKEALIKLILEKVDHDLLVLKDIMDEACHYGYQDVVTFLLENTDHEKLDIMEAVMSAYNAMRGGEYDDEVDIDRGREQKEALIKLILEKVDHDLLVLKDIMNEACRYGYQDVVTFLLENTDHEKLDIMKAVNIAYSSIRGEDDDEDEINEKREKKKHLIKLILEKVDHDLLDLKKIMDEACRYGYQNVVTFLLENTDHEKLDIMVAVMSAYNAMRGGEYDDEVDIDRDREQKEALIKLILEKVDHDLLVLKEIINESCRYGCVDVVTFLLENTDHETLDIMKAINKACIPSIDEETDNNICDNSINETLIKIFLQKVKTDLLDMEILMNEACRNGWLYIVRWLVENIDHSMFDVDTAINVVILHDSVKTLDIFKLLIQNISPNLLNIGTVIEQASRLNRTEKVLWLIQNKDSSLFEIKYVMNEACRNSNLQIMKYVMENMDRDCFDVRSAMNKACRSSKTNSLEAVKWLLENIPHDMLDLESAMNNACRYDIVSVVKWFWTTLDRKLFNVKTAWNNACYNCNEALLSYLINTMDENMLDKSKAMSQACRNYEEGDRVICLLFEQPNMNTPENCKTVLKEACVHSNRPIVEWLLGNTDIQPSELKEMLIYNIKATINKSNDEEKSNHESLVWFMLTHPKVKKLDRNDLSDVMEAVSSIGQLGMVQELWDNTEKNMFNMRVIINTACESGKFEIVDWFLQNNDLKSIDVQTVMVESCGYGWLKIVKLLLSKFNRDNFDMNTSMDEACSYGRYEIVKFLLKNFGSNLLDTKLVLEKSCGYGWKDIILWLFANIENISIDLKTCMFEACAQGRLEIVELFLLKYGANNFDVNTLIDISCKNSGNADVMTFLIENFDLKQSHLNIVIKTACTYSWTEIVSSTLDRCKHDKNIMEEAMKNACISGETEIVKLFLNKVDICLLGVKINMIISCHKGWDEVVSLLLERVDHSLFDFTAAMNEACRCGEADVVELLIQKVNRENFNFDTTIVEACKSHLNENLVLILLKYINRSTSDIEAVSGKAYDYGWRRVSSRLKRMIYNDVSK